MNIMSVKILLKRIAYLTQLRFLQLGWSILGGRREKAMGLSLNLHANTVWPGRRGLRLPNDNCRSKIVAYADLVQAHTVCNAIEHVQNPVIIDVGAHHGEYAVLLGGLLKQKNQGGVIIAIEPDAANMALLKENVQRNNLQDIVNIVECALSECSGEMDFVSQGSEGYLLPENSAGKKVTYKIKS